MDNHCDPNYYIDKAQDEWTNSWQGKLRREFFKIDDLEKFTTGKIEGPILTHKQLYLKRCELIKSVLKEIISHKDGENILKMLIENL